MTSIKYLLLSAAGLFLTFGIAMPAEAQTQAEEESQVTVKVGPRIGVPIGDVSDIGGDLFLGADARIDVGSLPDPVVLSPSLDFYLTDDFDGLSLTIFAVDLNAFYEFAIEDQTFVPYAGGGLAFTRISVDVDTGRFVNVSDPSTTEVGLNLVGGARYPLDFVEPFAQINVTAGAERIGITGGVLFDL